MNGAELVTATRDLLGEDTAASWSDALILRQINHSFRELYSEIVENNENFFATTALLNYTANAETITLPTSSKILRVEFVATALGLPTDKRAEWIDLARRDDYLVQTGNNFFQEDQRKLYLLGNSLGVVPVPTSNVTGALRVYYVPPATALTTGTSPPTEWSADHHEVIAWGASMRLLMRNKELLAENKPTFLRLRQLLLNVTSAREVQEPQMIVDTYGV